MGRPLRNIEPSDWVHTIFRTINRQFLFSTKKAHSIWLDCLERAQKRFDLKLYAWCGMNNHHHLLNQAPTVKYVEEEIDGVPFTYEEPTNYGQFLCETFSFFVRTFNRFFGRRSSLIDDRTKTVKVYDYSHALNLLIYIFLNPVRAGLVKHPRDYLHSNFRQWSNFPGTF